MSLNQFTQAVILSKFSNPYSINFLYFYSDVFKVRPNLHVGSSIKTLEPYNPTSYRNRLPIEDAPILTKNAS
jgi:hypothetical protein